MNLLTNRIRVIDAVILAAGALLALKVIAFLAAPSAPDRGADGLPKFARALAYPRSEPQPADPETTGSVDKKDASAPARGETPPTEAEPPPQGSASERALRERIAERREDLQRQARDLETREKLVEEAERRSDAKSEEARLAEERASAANSPETREAAALKGLVIMYEAMKPKDAARVFDRLPEDVLVAVVRKIAPRKMAEIMAAMNSESAQKLTVALARPAAAPQPAGAGSGLPPGELPAIEPARPASIRRN